MVPLSTASVRGIPDIPKSDSPSGLPGQASQGCPSVGLPGSDFKVSFASRVHAANSICATNGSAEKTVKAIRRATRRRYAAQEKIRIVLQGLRGEESIAELCRREQINQNLYYRWSKEFLEAGKKRLAGDTKREATSDEVKELRAQSVQLKELLAEMMLENRLLKKSVLGDGDVGI